MDDEALVGRVLERGGSCVSGRLLMPGRGQVRLGMRERVQLRGAGGKRKREGKQQPQEKSSAHAAIIHSPKFGSTAPETGYFAPARHWSRPAMNRSLGNFLPMKTMTDSFFSPLAHGLPTSPPIIMCTPWNTTRFELPFIHSTPL
jgi:hypothetical protein